MEKIEDVGEFFVGFIYPRRCSVCDKVLRLDLIGKKYETCEKCRGDLVYPEGNRCLRCSKSIGDEEIYCKDCLKYVSGLEKEGAVSNIESGRAALIYNDVMEHSIAKFKYGGRRDYAKSYARIIWSREKRFIEGIGAELLVPVPIHWTRLWKRGYNQALLLANALGDISGIEVAKGLLVRRKRTIAQKNLSKEDRRRNLFNAFDVDKNVLKLYDDKNCVIIIDDIYTTGSTVEACARSLKNCGFEKIYFLTLCIGSIV